jgi:hypothetical protein
MVIGRSMAVELLVPNTYSSTSINPLVTPQMMHGRFFQQLVEDLERRSIDTRMYIDRSSVAVVTCL